MSAPARLHLGLLGLDTGLARRFGGLGVAIDAPRTEVTVVAEGRDDVTQIAPEVASRLGPTETDEAAARLAELVVRHRVTGLPAPRAARVVLTAAPLAHVGLGSATQLALSVGTGLAHAAGYALAPGILARTLRRDLRSGIGLAAFESGGLAVDGGARTIEPDGDPGDPTPVIARHAVPDAWRFVVAVPNGERVTRLPAGRTGPDPVRERRHELVGEICRRVLVELLPALVEGDLGGFGRALTLVQRLAAEATAPAARRGPLAAAIVAALPDLGAVSAGQSAFGPACYGLVASEADAAAVAGRLAAWLAAREANATLFVAAPDNQGAQVSSSGAAGRARPRP